MRASLTIPAPAKLNLFLHITGRRADGYHDLESLIAFLGLADEITVTPLAAGRFTLVLDGPFADLPGLSGDDNLVLRAARALAAKIDGEAGAAIRLTKNIPVAAGLGGGSADAAAVLRALARLWRMDGGRMDEDIPAGIAPRLGADVPVCLAARPMLVGGVGEILTPVPGLPAAGVVLVNPGRAVATPAVFARLDLMTPSPFRARPAPRGPFDDVPALAAALGAATNDLTAPARALVPEIEQVITALAAAPDCRLARMAGSGATCFGLFDDEDQARAGAEAILRENPGWWCWAGGFADPA